MRAEHVVEPETPEPSGTERLPGGLLQVLADLNSDLNHDLVLDRICRSCVELTGASGAAFLLAEGTRARVAAVVDLPRDGLYLVIDAGPDGLAGLGRYGRRLVVPDLHDRPTVSPAVRRVCAGLHTAVITPVMARRQLVGALVALFPPVGYELNSIEADRLDMLAGYGGIAVANALAYEDAVRAEAHLVAVIDGINAGVAVLDRAGAVTAWNTAIARITGIPANQAVGQPFPLTTGTPEDPVEHDLGNDQWVEVVATPLDEGQVVAVHDISRQKALDAAKTLFVAATSHELKTPLTVIRSFAEWLRGDSGAADVEKRAMALDAIADSAEELRQIVEKILLTARTEAGAIDLDPRIVEPVRLVQAVARQFVVAGRGHTLVIDLPESLPEVDADVNAVRTALGQLLENAFKYSPDGGLVTVSARALPGGEVEISVADEGIGLALGESQYLFAAFYQGETRARSGVRGGVGLGLSIVRRLVEAHGGRVGAEGEPGHGSRFWFTLPAARPLDDDPADSGLDTAEAAVAPEGERPAEGPVSG
ncbi:MAG: PAS domain-containing protein [Acidimicrobiia bacterium]|nr:PAS domain-containing protein [Acidimicrobiia bacterium]